MIYPREEQTYETAEDAIDNLKTRDRQKTAEYKIFLENRRNSLVSTRKFCEQAGITDEALDRLSVIHITGTKGKGSACTLTERILAKHGYRTGLLISPHLQTMRERVRINGQPISAEKFNYYFWHVYNSVVTKEVTEDDHLPYLSQFFTLVALKVFTEEKVDVVILEVGIGGEYDHTNILKQPIVCGITSLDIDHVELLGETIPQIAWHKAGIMKPGAIGFTLPQPEDGLSVLAERAHERQCPLYLVPPYEEYQWEDGPVEVGIAGKMQRWNASLAVQMTKAWMERHELDFETRLGRFAGGRKPTPQEIPFGQRHSIDKDTESAIRNCWFPGRHQIIRKGDTIYYLDCAHTVNSMRDCADWYRQRRETDAVEVGDRVKRVMIYNLFDQRPLEKLLPPFAEMEFDGVAFCPNMKDEKEFNKNLKKSEGAIEKCWYNHAIWRQLTEQKHKEPTKVCRTTIEAIEWCHQLKQDASLLQILVVGGTGIVGNALKILDPIMNE